MQELPGLTGDKPVHRIDGEGLCELLSCSPALLTELKKRGIAIHLGKDAYDLVATVQAYVLHLRGTASGRGGEADVAKLTTERARLAKEQADAQSLKNAALRKELVPVADVEREWSSILSDLRAELLALPGRAGAKLPHLTSSDIAELESEVRASLEGLADGR